MTAPKKAVPASARKPQDHRPKKAKSTEAQMAEAADGYVTVEQNGMIFRIPITQEAMGAKVVLGALMGDSDQAQMLKLIGEDKLGEFVDMDPEPSADDLLSLFEKVKEALGSGN